MDSRRIDEGGYRAVLDIAPEATTHDDTGVGFPDGVQQFRELGIW
jgi:hypothetical protein